MKYDIQSAAELGAIIRASRKALELRQDDAAGSMGVSENFLRKVERGGERAQLGMVLHVLAELGINLSVEVPDDLAKRVEEYLLLKYDGNIPSPTKRSAHI